MSKYLVLLLFAGALSIGLGTFKNYGISWDEGDQRHLGLLTYHYFSYGKDSLEHCDNREYGASFELPLIWIEKGLNLHDSRSIYLMRHLVTHLFFLLGAVAFFLLIDYYFKNKLFAVIGFFMLVTEPVIYSHSFYNSKDIVFLSMYCICYFLTVLAFDKNKLKYYIWLGIGCGLLTNLRVMGCLLIFCLSLFFLTDYLRADKKKRKQIYLSFGCFFMSSLLVLYITSPFLWPNPVQNIVYVFKDMASHYPVQVLFDGRNVNPQNVPYYAITLFGITTPLVYLLAGITGIVVLGICFLKRPLHFCTDRKERNMLLFAIGFFQPLLSVILFHSEIFDGWRHLFFIYPSFVLLAIYGLSCLFHKKGKWIYITIIAVGICTTIGFIISAYPFENVYFNRLAGKQTPENLRNKWELDYWGNSYYQALKYIVETDTAAKINVQVIGLVGEENAWLLKPDDRKRICFTDGTPQPEYFVGWYKNHPQDYPFENKEVYSIRALNSKIVSVFKLQ